MTQVSDTNRDLLRHTLATLAYRGGKVVRDAPPEFATFRLGAKSRTPVEILAHIGDLLDWALTIAKGAQKWNDATPGTWEQESARFFAGLAALESLLASNTQLACAPEKLFQGPIADALTHVGQISMMRRLAGSPVRGESYFKADIRAGRVGSDQSAPAYEFD